MPGTSRRRRHPPALVPSRGLVLAPHLRRRFPGILRANRGVGRRERRVAAVASPNPIARASSASSGFPGSPRSCLPGRLARGFLVVHRLSASPRRKRSSRCSLPEAAGGPASPQSRIHRATIARKKILGKRFLLPVPAGVASRIHPHFRIGALINRKSCVTTIIEVCEPERPQPGVTPPSAAVAPCPPPRRDRP
jgi:hypothetical protein